MAQRGRPPKGQYEDLEQVWKDRVNGLSREQLEHEISTVAYAQAELMKLKSEDQDLASTKQAAKDAGQVYAEGSKINKLKILYSKECLDNAGGPTKTP